MKKIIYSIIGTLFFNILVSKPFLEFAKTSNNKGLIVKLVNNINNWTEVKKEQIKFDLYNNPKKIIEENKKINFFLDTNSFESLNELDLKYPIFTICECVFNYCKASRINNPDIRTKIEDFTVHQIIQKYKTKKINYTSFASGRLFPDLRIISKLIDLSFNQININFIDIEWQEFIQNNRIESNNINYYLFIQFLNWLSTEKTFITCTIYSSANDYIQECEIDNELKSDIITGFDYVTRDDLLENFNNHPLTHFQKLICYGLKNPGIAISMYNYYKIWNNEIILNNIKSDIIYKTSEIPKNEILNSFNKQDLKRYYSDFTLLNNLKKYINIEKI